MLKYSYKDNGVDYLMLQNKIKAIRKEMTLTQEEFAKKLGISRSYLADLERGRLKGNNINILSKLSQLTGKPLEYFFYNDDKPKLYNLLDATIDLFIDKNMISKDGHILDDTTKNVLLEILEKEIKMKIEIKKG